MASKRAKRRRECEKKKRYSTEKEASAMRWHIGEKNPAKHPRHTYKCPHCGGYHIGRGKINKGNNKIWNRF